MNKAERSWDGVWLSSDTATLEAGRDGFWLARWLAARGVEAHVIHASRR